MKKQAISVKEIAELAGTSTATVSRVLNRNGRYSKETEQRVLQVIEETGYRRNEIARALRAVNTNLVGILVPDISNSFYSSLVKVIQDELIKSGIVSLVCNTDELYEQALRFARVFEDHNADGIIYIGNNELKKLPQMPVVYVDRDPRDEMDLKDQEYAMIECDNIQGGYLAGGELVKKGCREFVYVAYDLNIVTHKKRLSGFCKALDEAGLSIADDHIFNAETLAGREGWMLMEQIRKSFPTADGVFFASDSLAVGALEYMKQNGVAVPEQVKLVGFDDLSISEILKLTSVSQPVREMGKLTAQRMMALIAGEPIPQQRERLPVKLMVRSTT